MLSKCEGYPSRAVMAQYNASMCPTGMTLALGGVHPPPCPHATLAPCGMRARWGRGGGHAPPRASVMLVGHMDAPHPYAAWAFWVGRSSWAAYIICVPRRLIYIIMPFGAA